MWLLVLPIVDWAAVVALWRFVRRHSNLAPARDRRNVALGVALMNTVLGSLALARLGHIVLPDNTAALLVVATATLLSAVNAVFLWQYRHALFGKVPAALPDGTPAPPEDDSGH